MIGRQQLALLEHALVHTEVGADDVARVLQEEAPGSALADFSIALFDSVMDRLTVYGYRDRRRPVLSADTLQAIKALLDGTGMSAFEAETYLRRHGQVGDYRDLDGDGLLRLLVSLERHRAPVTAFIASRGTVTPKQLALLHVARQKVDHSEGEKWWALQHLAGVNSSADLDQRGFDLMMADMRNRGFKPAKANEAPTFGQRPGFASPAQIALIRDLWAEWSGADDEGALNSWIERFYHVSTLRFLNAATASKAITALKAMKRRAAEATKVMA